MEIYTLYLSISLFCSNPIQSGNIIAVQKTASSLITGLSISLAVWAALFVLQGIGLYMMAKRRNFKHKWLAFVPFANLIYIGKLAGDCEVFGHRMKGAGVYTMIAQIIATVCCAFVIFAEIYLYSVYGAPNYIPTEMGTTLPLWTGLTATGETIFELYRISDYILSIVELIYQVLLLILLMGLYRRYNPMNYRMMAFLSFFIPIARYIVVFTQRKRAAIDFEAYMRARREAFIRRQQQFNPYGNPYGNPYSSPYGTQNRQDEQGGQQEPEDPFAEFFDGEKSSDETKENDSQNGSGNHFGDGFDSFFQ